MAWSRTHNEKPEEKIAKCTKCEQWKPFESFTVFSEEQRKKKGLRRHTHSECLECMNNRSKERDRKKRVARGLPPEPRKREDLERGVAKCNKCGSEKPFAEFPLSDHYSKCITHSWCKQCHKEWRKARGALSAIQLARSRKRRKQTIQGRAEEIWKNIEGRCRREGIPFDLTVEWFLERLKNGKCEATGEPFDICDAQCGPGSLSPSSPSVDREPPGMPYLQEHCRLTTIIFNYAKKNWDDQDVIRMSYWLLIKNGFEVTPPEGWSPKPPTFTTALGCLPETTTTSRSELDTASPQSELTRRFH